MKIRLDQLVVDRGLAPSRDAAKRLILAGKIRVNTRVSDKPGKAIAADAKLELHGKQSPYVSRGGVKLAGALDALGLKIPADCLALDIGASTGGFTDCLLQRGAGRVIAVDVGRGQIHERLRVDPRVALLERENARYLTLEKIGGDPAHVIVIDVSFISLRLILPPCTELLARGGLVVALVKPQFEAGRKEVGSGGIVRDAGVHRAVLERIEDFCVSAGWRIMGWCASSLLGADGNVEFFVALSRSDDRAYGPGAAGALDIERALREAYLLRTGAGKPNDPHSQECDGGKQSGESR